ncbi:hypothetical protein C8Q79DRAFT_968167 [Trametes meyenii]|nr:hypothetical protein C8Q79DRAFT_968167 [Trametes meyenii]
MPPKSTTTAKPTSKAGVKPGAKPGASRQKAAPKQPLPVADRLKRLFTSLCAQIDGGHFANTIKTCDKILRLDPHDADALQTKLFLLLQTDQYAAALTLIGGDSGDNAFGKAYSLYRLHREDEATGVLKSLKTQEVEDDRGHIHLEAQLAYRQGSYQIAVDLYNQLLDTAEPDSEEQSDIVTNLEAAQKHLDFINSGFLHALDALPSTVSNTLQTAPPPQQQLPTAFTPIAAPNLPSPDHGEDATKRPKKVRMKRVPQGVVPGVTPPPDPERWVKKSERSTFTNRRRRGGGGATQGVVETAAQSAKGAGGGKGKRKK